MANKTISELLQEAIKSSGEQFVRQMLERAASIEDCPILTVVSNRSVHPIPDEFMRGEVYFASEGQFDFSDAESVTKTYEKILRELSKKLREKRWSRIYILPFGPTALSMQIKLLVQKVLSIESIEIVHLGNGRYGFIEIAQRSLIAQEVK